MPTLPIEISRGCWWRRRKKDGRTPGCAFCNLNLQWRGYRQKSPSRVAREVDLLTRRHRTLKVAFTDNVLPAGNTEEIFQRVGRLEKDLQLFCEIRATAPARALAEMKAAGVDRVQIGIEALSTRLLERMNKGTTTIENLEVLKQCEALGIRQESNLMLCFPGSDADDVRETLHNLAFAAVYRPMRPVTFWLGIGSPVWYSPGAYGVKAVFNHPHYRVLFPAAVTRAVGLTIQGYRGDQGHQRRLWAPVRKRIREWHKGYAALRREGCPDPILGYRDGGDFLVIRHRRIGGDPLLHRLEGSSRAIYLFCGQRQSLGRILAAFPSFNEEQLRSFLEQMVAKRLMFAEGEQYLSLAIPCR
jgi:hypothetical protein